MKKPTLRVTKSLSDIPVEAHCTQFPAMSFQGAGGQSSSEPREVSKVVAGPV